MRAMGLGRRRRSSALRWLREVQRSALLSTPRLALVRGLGLLGWLAVIVALITWPLVGDQAHSSARVIVLLAVGAGSIAALVWPGRWITRWSGPLIVVAAITMQAGYSAATGGLASPYRAGFVAIVLIVAFLGSGRLTALATLLGLAGLVFGAGIDGIDQPELATILTSAGLSAMVAATTFNLAASQRRELRRLQGRMVRLDRRSERRLHESLTDPLARVGNRRRFEIDLGALAHERRGSITLALADIDHLKMINDRFGHPIGDQAIQLIAGALRSHLRADDRVYRIGGDEFAALVKGLTAEALTKRLGGSLVAQLPEVGEVRASVGAVDVDPARVDEAVPAADRALYAAKSAGRSAANRALAGEAGG